MSALPPSPQPAQSTATTGAGGPGPGDRTPRPARRSALGAGLLAGLLVTLLLGQPGCAWGLSDAQQLVVEAWRLVNQSYVAPEHFEAIHWRQLRQRALEQPIRSSGEAYDAIDALLRPLGDPYTKLLRPADFASLRASTEGHLSGVGLQLGLRPGDGAIVVIAPLEDSPAAAAGIASGSRLISIETEDVSELGLEASAARLRGPHGSRVRLTLQPPGGTEREVVLERQNLDLHPVRQRLLRSEPGPIGYLRISQFSEPVPRQVSAALADFDQEGATALVLDLRNNSGGLVSAGLAVADSFLAGGPVVETRDRDGLSTLNQARAARQFSGPMVVLVNGGTASASEIVAGALQDNDRADLLGSRTFGKGLIQTLQPLGDGSGLSVTVARYLTPSGRDIQNEGIEPDLALPQPEPLNPGGDDDPWLDLACTRLELSLASRAAPDEAVQPRP